MRAAAPLPQDPALRAPELTRRLHAALGECIDLGDARILTVWGPAEVGQSELVRQSARALAPPPVTAKVYQLEPSESAARRSGTDAILHRLARQRLKGGPDHATAARAIEPFVAAAEVQSTSAALAALATSRTTRLTPRTLRAARAALYSLLRSDTRERPHIFILPSPSHEPATEAAHLTSLVEHLAASPALFILVEIAEERSSQGSPPLLGERQELQSVRVPKWPREEIAALLDHLARAARIAPPVGAVRDELLDLCDGRPARVRRLMSPAAATVKLTREELRGEPPATPAPAPDWCWQRATRHMWRARLEQLPDPARRLLCRLAVLPEPFARMTVTALAPPHKTRDSQEPLLDDLVAPARASLESLEQRGLLRQVLPSESPSAVARAIDLAGFARFAHPTLRRASAAELSARERDATLIQALDWFRCHARSPAEWIAAAQVASEAGHRALAALALAEAGDDLGLPLATLRSIASRKESAADHRDLSVNSPTAETRARLALIRGRAALRAGELDQAATEIETGRAIAVSLASPLLLARCQAQAALLQLHRGEGADALRLSLAAVTAARLSDDPTALLEASSARATVLGDAAPAGAREEAREIVQALTDLEALEMADRGHGATAGWGGVLVATERARLALRCGEPRAAHAALDSATLALAERDAPWLEGLVALSRADLLLASGAPRRAAALAREAAARARDGGERVLELRLEIRAAEAAGGTPDATDEGSRHAGQTLRAVRRTALALGGRWIAMEALSAEVRLWERAGLDHEATEAAEALLKLSTTAELRRFVGEALEQLAKPDAEGFGAAASSFAEEALRLWRDCGFVPVGAAGRQEGAPPPEAQEVRSQDDPASREARGRKRSQETRRLG